MNYAVPREFGKWEELPYKGAANTCKLSNESRGLSAVVILPSVCTNPQNTHTHTLTHAHTHTLTQQQIKILTHQQEIVTHYKVMVHTRKVSDTNTLGVLCAL